MPEYVDKPEPRGQTIAAVLAIGAIYLALPRNLVVGPIWLLPTVIVGLLVPTVVSHRVGNSAGAPFAYAPGICIADCALRRTTLADECDRVCTLVLAAGRRRANPAPERKKIRQQEFPFSTNADSARRTARICVCTLASALCRLSLRGVHTKFY